jgi:NADH:ubiquinone oxidoreductase subunit 2 (subunit N)
MLGVLSSVAFAVRMMFSVQQGQTEIRHNVMNELRFIEAFPAILLLTFVIVLGCYPIIFVDLMELEFHNLYAFWGQIETKLTDSGYNFMDILALDSVVWQLPVVLSVIMSLVIWLVNHKQQNLYRMLVWQAVYYVLTLIVVISSAHALSVTLDMQRIVLIAIGYLIMFIGYYSTIRTVGSKTDATLYEIQGLYYRQPVQAFVLLLFNLALMSAPLTVGFTFQLSMIELWSAESQYGLIMLWLVARALMATIPLEVMIQMYMNSEHSSGLLQEKLRGVEVQPNKLRGFVVISYISLLVVLSLVFWI